MKSISPPEFSMYVHQRVLVSANHFPYLSLLTGPDRKFYFLHWLDVTTTITQGIWLMYPVTFEQLTTYTDKKCSLRSIMESAPWFVRFLGAPEMVTGYQYRWEDIPEKHRPTQNSFWHELLQEND